MFALISEDTEKYQVLKLGEQILASLGPLR